MRESNLNTVKVDIESHELMDNGDVNNRDNKAIMQFIIIFGY